ncbi:hypothetical protein ACWELB_01800 [Streptomyces asiaticus]
MTFRGRAEVRKGFELMLAYDAGLESRPGGVAFIAGDRGASQWSYTGTDADGRVHDLNRAPRPEHRRRGTSPVPALGTPGVPDD